MAKITDLEEVKKIEKLKKDVRDAAIEVIENCSSLDKVTKDQRIKELKENTGEISRTIYSTPEDFEKRTLMHFSRSKQLADSIKKLDLARDSLQDAMQQATKTRSSRRMSTETTSARRAGMLAGLAVITGVLSILFPPLLLVSGLFAIGAGYYGAKYAGGVAGRSMGRGWANARQGGFSYDLKEYSKLRPADIKNAVDFVASLQAASPHSQPTSVAPAATTTPPVIKPAAPPPPPPPRSQGPIEVVITSNDSDFIVKRYDNCSPKRNGNEVTLTFNDESERDTCFNQLAHRHVTFLASTSDNKAIAVCKDRVVVYNKAGTDYSNKSTEVARALVSSSNLNQGNPPSRTNNSTSTPNPTPNHNP